MVSLNVLQINICAMKQKLIGLLLCMSCAYPTAAQQATTDLTDQDKLLDAMHQYITTEKIFGYVVQLSDSTLEGRLAGSKGMEKAVSIVQGYYNSWGLTPLAGSEEYLQIYPHPHVEVAHGSYMEILFPLLGKNKERNWISKSYPWADGWFAGNMTDNGEVEAEIVYAGFGITAPELDYDDYKGINVKGKIVLIEGETPNVSRTKESLTLWYPHTLHQTKLNNAVKHGAIGMLYKWVPGPNAPYNPGFIYCHVTEKVVDDIFCDHPKSYKECVKQIYDTQKPASFYTGKRARIKMNATYHPHSTGKNILGVIAGSDPNLADEYVVISAHLDHLGMIPYHIAGANDNNASTAALLGVAEAFAKSEIKPKRSILFMTLDGEEAGLTGSTYYTKNPLIPQEKIKAIVNLEQLGGGDKLGAAYHYEYPHLGEIVKEANDKYIHRQLFLRENQFITRPRTDGAVFMKAGYPCVDIRAVGGGYYHHPKDDVASINPEILRASTEWLFWITYLLANE